MNTVSWCNGTFDDEKAQSLLEEKIALLLKGPLASKDEYQQEKAIKVFSEGLGRLEKLLLYQNQIHPSNIDMMKVTMNPKDFCEKKEDISNILQTEIKRQYRHFTIFL